MVKVLYVPMGHVVHVILSKVSLPTGHCACASDPVWAVLVVSYTTWYPPSGALHISIEEVLYVPLGHFTHVRFPRIQLSEVPAGHGLQTD